jgi:hypothetical protein
MPATVAITAVAMPTNIPKSTCRGRSTSSDAAWFASGTSRINAGDVDKRYLPMNAPRRLRRLRMCKRGTNSLSLAGKTAHLPARSYQELSKFGSAASWQDFDGAAQLSGF